MTPLTNRLLLVSDHIVRSRVEVCQHFHNQKVDTFQVLDTLPETTVKVLRGLEATWSPSSR